MTAISTKTTSDGAHGPVPLMTLPDVARYLKVSEKTVFRLVQNGSLPAVKVSNQWRFLPETLDAWLRTQMQGTPRPAVLPAAVSPRDIPLTRIIAPEHILPDVQPGDKRFVLEQLLAPLARDGLVADPEAYLRELLRREEIVSTAIGHGVACPHIRHPGALPAARTCAVIGRCPQGADFAALDGAPTYLFALPCTASEEQHLPLMARLLRLFRAPGMLDALQQARSAADLLRILVAADAEQQWPQERRS